MTGESSAQAAPTELEQALDNSFCMYRWMRRELLSGSPYPAQNVNMRRLSWTLKHEITDNEFPLYYDNVHYTSFLPAIATVFILFKTVPLCLLESFIAKGGDINQREGCDWKNYSLLSFAARYEHLDALRCLLERGADASHVSPFDIVPHILNASEADLPKKEKIALYQKAIENGLDINKPFKQEDLLVCTANYVSHISAQGLKTFLRTPTRVPNAGMNLLHATAMAGNIESLNILLSAPKINQSLYQENQAGYVPWEIPARMGDAPALRVLLRAMYLYLQDVMKRPTKCHNGDPRPTQFERLKRFLITQSDISKELENAIKCIEILKLVKASAQFPEDAEEWEQLSQELPLLYHGN